MYVKLLNKLVNPPCVDSICAIIIINLTAFIKKKSSICSQTCSCTSSIFLPSYQKLLLIIQSIFRLFKYIGYSYEQQYVKFLLKSSQQLIILDLRHFNIYRSSSSLKILLNCIVLKGNYHWCPLRVHCNHV